MSQNLQPPLAEVRNQVIVLKLAYVQIIAHKVSAEIVEVDIQRPADRQEQDSHV